MIRVVISKTAVNYLCRQIFKKIKNNYTTVLKLKSQSRNYEIKIRKNTPTRRKFTKH